MSLAAWVEHHRRSLLFIAFALAAAGIFAGATLPVGLFPVISFPRIRVEVSSGSMPANQMLTDATQPLEEVARAVPGAVDVISRTGRGSAQIFLDFPWGSDMQRALLSVDAAFAEAMPTLPQGTQYAAIQMSPNAVMPFVSYALTSAAVPSSELRRLARHQITPLLTSVPGVQRVDVLGGQTPEVEVNVNPAKLRAYNLTLASITTAISATNTIRVIGRLSDNDLLYLAIANNQFRSINSVRDVVLPTKGGGIVRLSDIATIKRGNAPQWLLVDNNGKPAVTFGVFQQNNAHSLALEKEVGQRLASFMKTQPNTIHLSKWYDQAQLVRSSIGALEEAILIGLVFAALVILGFLRNWRAALVAIVVVVLSVLITVLLLRLLGMTFNIMTLGGIAAAIGLLIDDVIVMVEQIARRAGEPGIKEPKAHVLLAAREFLSPQLGSSLATIIIFIPLAFLSGVTGAFFKFLSLTMASALIISFLLTALIAPLLARGWIDFGKWTDPGHGRETWLRRAHRSTLRILFAQPLLIVAGVAVLIGAGYIGYKHVGTGFLPRMDEGGFVLDYHTAPGTSLAETNREIGQVEAILKKDPYVYTFSRRTGAGLGGDLAETYQGDLFVRLVPPGRRPDIWKVMDEIGKQVVDEVPGISFDTHQLLSDMIGDMVGRHQPVVIKLSAKNPDVLVGVAKKVADAIRKVPGIRPESVNDGVVPAGDALVIHVDPAAAAMEGVTPQAVQASLYHYLNGAVVTKYLGYQENVGVRLWLDPPQEKIYRDQLGELPVRSPSGTIFPLKTVATIHFVAGQPEIDRDNLQQIVAVTAQIGGGRDLGSTITGVEHVLRQPGLLSNGVHYTIGGTYKQQQTAVRGMVRVFGTAVIAEIILLLFLYERFALPFIIITSAVISTCAVFIGLWVTGVELNITAMMGMVMIVGIGTEMAVFLVSEYQALAKAMPPREALYEAALNRQRPIVMSSLAMILALLPLGAAISGSGDQMLQPLAIAIIAGVIVQLPLVLLALPVVIGVTARNTKA